MLLGALVLIAAVLIYVWGIASLLYVALFFAFGMLYVWVADGVTHRKQCREAGEKTGSLLHHMNTSWRETLAANERKKAQKSVGSNAVSTAQVPKAPAPKADAATPSPIKFGEGKISLPCDFSFFYEDHHGERSHRTVRVTDVGTNGAQKYLEGFCQSRQATRTFRVDRITSHLTDVSTGELFPVARLLRDVQERTAVTFTPTSTGFKRNDQAAQRSWETAVFFAGFRGGKLDELEALASGAGWQVRGSITSTVDYVVFNGSAGKAQLAKADSLGIPVIDEDAFRGLV